MHTRTKLVQQLGALFGLGVLAFNSPLVAVFDRPGVVAGIPLFYFYLFGVWAALIGVVTWVIQRGRH